MDVYLDMVTIVVVVVFIMQGSSVVVRLDVRGIDSDGVWCLAVRGNMQEEENKSKGRDNYDLLFFNFK